MTRSGFALPFASRSNIRIAEIRRKLGEDAAELIETIPGEGYRFVGNVKTG